MSKHIPTLFDHLPTVLIPGTPKENPGENPTEPHSIFPQSGLGDLGIKLKLQRLGIPLVSYTRQLGKLPLSASPL